MGTVVVVCCFVFDWWMLGGSEYWGVKSRSATTEGEEGKGITASSLDRYCSLEPRRRRRSHSLSRINHDILFHCNHSVSHDNSLANNSVIDHFAIHDYSLIILAKR